MYSELCHALDAVSLLLYFFTCSHTLKHTNTLTHTHTHTHTQYIYIYVHIYIYIEREKEIELCNCLFPYFFTSLLRATTTQARPPATRHEDKKGQTKTYSPRRNLRVVKRSGFIVCYFAEDCPVFTSVRVLHIYIYIYMHIYIYVIN